jgi:hypothetical protein
MFEVVATICSVLRKACCMEDTESKAECNLSGIIQRDYVYLITGAETL